MKEAMGNFFNHSVLVVINRYFILGAKSLSVMPSNEVNAWVMEEGHRDSLRIIITHDDSFFGLSIYILQQATSAKMRRGRREPQSGPMSEVCLQEAYDQRCKVRCEVWSKLDSREVGYVRRGMTLS